MNHFSTLVFLISISLRSRRRMVCQSSAWVDAHQRRLSRLCCCCGRRQMIHQITAYTVYKIANGNVFIKSETEFGRAKVTKQASKSKHYRPLLISRATVYILVWSASTHSTEYSLASFSILTLVLAHTRVASTKQVTSGASFKLSKKRVL
jgi:hypothetical protein